MPTDPMNEFSSQRDEVGKEMRILKMASGFLLVLASLVLTVSFLLLRKYFGYPTVIRKGPDVILPRLQEMEHLVPYLFYSGVGGGGLCLFLSSPLLAKIFARSGDGLWSSMAKYCGMTAGFCFYTGILRWTFLFPMLARYRSSGTYDARTIDLVFESFHTYVGETLAEHVGFIFMTMWLVFLSLAVLKTKVLARWLGYAGLGLAVIIGYGNLEFFNLPGAFWANREGVDLAGIWFLAVGISLLASTRRTRSPAITTMSTGVP